MLNGSSRPGGAGSELNRLLARLAPPTDPTDPRTPSDTRPAFVERLGDWLGWTGAIALSEVLAARSAPGVGGQAPAGDAGPADFQRVLSAQQAANAAGPAEPADAVLSPTGFGPCRRHIAARQQAMQDAVGLLRLRLRGALAGQSPAGARLAAIDAVMEHSLAAHERSLLALVPLRLQARFERAAQALQPQGADSGALQAFRATFLDDMACVLQAELAHRLLPAQGLLDALHDKRP